MEPLQDTNAESVNSEDRRHYTHADPDPANGYSDKFLRTVSHPLRGNSNMYPDTSVHSLPSLVRPDPNSHQQLVKDSSDYRGNTGATLDQYSSARHTFPSHQHTPRRATIINKLDKHVEKKCEILMDQISNLGNVDPNLAPTGSEFSQNRVEGQEDEGELSIPLKHTTAAHKLLGWPAVNELLHPLLYSEDYVMQFEESRGLISIFGQGEFSYSADDRQVPTGNISNGPKTTSPQGAGAASNDDVDIDEFGNLKLDATTAMRYYNSYRRHMFKLHPFLREGELDTMVRSFILCYARSVSNDTQPSCDGLPPVQSTPLNKSLRIHGELTETNANPPRPRVGKNIDNALVMLCLALGAICETRVPLSGPIFPGQTLYGYATIILGHLQGGNDLEHIHAALLAGLYMGQLAHPFQSHSWISQACRACQVLVRTKRYEQLEEGLTRDLHNFAYWTCLQLESDLLAELDIPPSGISLLEGRISIPKGKWSIIQPNDHINTMVMMYYSAQIHLRKLLNRVHTCLYKSKTQGQTNWSSTLQEALSLNLDRWRQSLPQSMQWDDADPPANEINAARMRAKYYGARYIIHRPLLYHALHYGNTGVRTGPLGQLLFDSPSDNGSIPAAGWQPPKVSLNNIPRKLRAACDICIKSAIKSTEAFDGLGGDRLVVTNIFGTAHAQFGNMLVLAATYKSSLNELVEKGKLDRLLKRTIGFLAQSKDISPTLRADGHILTELYRNIFGRLPDIGQATSVRVS
ncbi:uncharacterized protein PGRI_093290 [Penicillium griseofulvum]|uniref:Transcription factor n=1 Tax=Penicillium patulum TaxID=5078 RepID=A0A135LQR6_PENPA|nr:uncharacterized protein PGRI_093290 [Penicillium griseofulvum]KXG51317.1 hypothetical protein PGRI_093290 [Penicillium griseofulvum]